MDINKHKFLLTRILKDIYTNTELAASLGFRGGTALMFFYGLPRFSVDLDFNLIDLENEGSVYEKVNEILLKYGGIHDKAQKFHGPLLVLDYGAGQRKLKVEIFNRIFDNHYEIKNFLGINMNVMAKPDMFAHKLCALMDRKSLANRDIFDCWFFMDQHTPINKNIVETRMKMPFADYLQKCIPLMEKKTGKNLLQGLGELMDNDMKKFVKGKLLAETIGLIKFYKEFPITDK